MATIICGVNLDKLTPLPLTQEQIERYYNTAISTAQEYLDDAIQAGGKYGESQGYGIKTLFTGDGCMDDADYLEVIQAWVTEDLSDVIQYVNDQEQIWLEYQDQDLWDLINPILEPVNFMLEKAGYDFLSVAVGRNENFGTLQIEVILDGDFLEQCSSDDPSDFSNIVGLVLDGETYHVNCLNTFRQRLADPIFNNQDEWDSFPVCDTCCHTEVSKNGHPDPLYQSDPRNFTITDVQLTSDGYTWLYQSTWDLIKDLHYGAATFNYKLCHSDPNTLFLLYTQATKRPGIAYTDGYTVYQAVCEIKQIIDDIDDQKYLVDMILDLIALAEMSVYSQRVYELYTQHSLMFRHDFVAWIMANVQ